MEHGDLYRQIVRSFTDGIVALEFDGTIRFANPSAEALLGVERLQGRHVGEFLDEDGREHAVGYLTSAATGDFLADEVDTMLVRADGKPLWVRLRQTALLDGDTAVGIILRLTDNHETKRLLEAVSASNERLERAERIARSGSWTWDLQAGTVSWSQGLTELYGDLVPAVMSRDREQVVAITHPEDHQRLLAAIDRLVHGDAMTAEVELRQRGRHGWMWVRLRALANRGDDGTLLDISGTFQDVTRARDTEDQLQDLVTQNSLMQAVATAANEATTLDEVLGHARSLVVLHDDWDRARAFVPSADGSSLVPHLVAGEDGPADEPTDGASAEVAALELATALACFRSGEAVWDDDHRLTIAFPIRLDGEILAVVTITSQPPLHRHDLIRQMVEQASIQLARVAERERAAQQLADARDRAVKASQHKSEFLATMSHEIRTPLNGIIGLNELLGATELSDHQQHLASGIAVSSRSLLELINDILDFSKIEAGRLEVESVDFEVREVLAEVANVLAESARAREIELQISCSPDVPDVLAGDPVRLKQVLLNLGSNAVKFTSVGSVAIRATASPTADGAGTELRVEVRDTGMGITPAQQRHIFTPFMQADTSTTRRFGGTGLGLAISAEIVAAFGGEIGVESEPGTGSTFWFTARLGAATGGTEDSTLSRARHALGGKRVLVVDDNPQNRMILCEQLGWWDVVPTGAEDPDAAMAALAAAAEATPYDAVLLDLAMPGQDGLSLAAAAREAGYSAGLPVIMLTSSYAPTDDQQRAAGITACLTKPVPSSTLRDVLLAALDHGRAPEASDQPAPASGHGLVLVVEDNAINQLVARGFLEAMGYAVETADDGEAALELLHRGSYDAVLMDVQMPRLDGYDTTRALRAEGARDRRGRRLPIVAMTAAAVAGERERCLAAGMDDFITKPVSPTDLAATLARWIGETPDAAPSRTGGDGPASPHLDLERLGMLLELRPDDTSYLDRAIGNFLGRRADVVAALTDAVEADDATALVASSHGLRGSAGNLGLPVVAAIAGDLESLGLDDSTAGAGALLANLVEALDEACTALAGYRDWYHAPAPSRA